MRVKRTLSKGQESNQFTVSLTEWVSDWARQTRKESIAEAAVARRIEEILCALSPEHSLIGKTSKWGTWRHVSEKRLRSNSLRLKCRGWNIYHHVEILSVQLGNQCSHAMKLDSSDGQMVTRRRRLCSKISHGNVALVGEKLPSLNKETQVKIIAFSLASNCLSLVPY